MLRRLMQTLITVIVLFYVLLIVAALLSDRLIFQPQRASYTDRELIEGAARYASRRADGPIVGGWPPAQVVKLRSGDHTITALYIPNPQATYTLLFSHGNAEDIGDNLQFFAALREAGFAVFAYDYRGYGTSDGVASERGVHQDVEAAYDYLTGGSEAGDASGSQSHAQQTAPQSRVPQPPRGLGVSPSRIISHGRSVGSAAAIHLAASRPVAALIAESPFLSAFRVLTRIPLLPFDKFANAELMPRIHVPVLVIHGRNDHVIPFDHGQRIYDLANPPKQNLWVDRAGHNDLLYVAGPSYFQALQAFASSLSRQ